MQFKVVKLSEIYRNKQYQKYLSQISQPDIVQIDGILRYFSVKTQEFFGKDFNFVFKGQIDQIVQSESNVQVLEDFDINLGPASFEVDYDILIDAFTRGKLTVDALYTFLMSFETVKNREGTYFGTYYNDFNLAWKSRRDGKGFDERFETARKTISDMIKKIPKSENGHIKVEFYARKQADIDDGALITSTPAPASISTKFTIHEFNIDLNNPSEAIISMLMWMMLEPNIFSVIKWGSKNFLYLDIYNLFDQSHVDERPSIYDPVDGTFVWGNEPGFTLADFEDFRTSYESQFEYGDIMHFISFHNHELDDRFDNIIDYIKDKIFEYFRSKGILDKNSEIKELRP